MLCKKKPLICKSENCFCFQDRFKDVIAEGSRDVEDKITTSGQFFVLRMGGFEFEGPRIFRCPRKTPNLGTRDSHGRRVSDFPLMLLLARMRGLLEAKTTWTNSFLSSSVDIDVWICDDIFDWSSRSACSWPCTSRTHFVWLRE